MPASYGKRCGEVPQTQTGVQFINVGLAFLCPPLPHIALLNSLNFRSSGNSLARVRQVSASSPSRPSNILNELCLLLVCKRLRVAVEVTSRHVTFPSTSLRHGDFRLDSFFSALVCIQTQSSPSVSYWLWLVTGGLPLLNRWGQRGPKGLIKPARSFVKCLWLERLRYWVVQ